MAFEMERVGIQWHNMYRQFDNTDFTTILYMMLVDGFIYGIIGWYCRNLMPGNL